MPRSEFAIVGNRRSIHPETFGHISTACTTSAPAVCVSLTARVPLPCPPIRKWVKKGSPIPSDPTVSPSHGDVPTVADDTPSDVPSDVAPVGMADSELANLMFLLLLLLMARTILSMLLLFCLTLSLEL